MKNHVFKIIGILLTVFSFIFIVRCLLRSDFSGVISRISSTGVFIGILLAVSFSLVLLGFVFNWQKTVKLFSGVDLRFSEALSVYLKTNIAKYLPTNILHFAGRHYLLSAKYGIDNTRLVLINATEIAGMVFISGVIAVLSLALGQGNIFKQMVPVKGFYSPLWAAVCLVIFLCLLFYIGYRCFKDRFFALLGNFDFFCLLKILVVYFFLFLMMGGIFVLVYSAILRLPVDVSRVLLLVGTFSFAWVAGFVVPGAPGGMGIRESVMVIMLSALLGGEMALLGALLFRAITILGDVIAFVYSFVISKRFLPEGDF